MSAKRHHDFATWQPRSRKRKSKRRESWVARLEPLAGVREAFLDCHRAIVRSALSQYLPPEGPLVEVGAGLGQLAHWLDSEGEDRWIHTEPDAGALAKLRDNFPAANVKQARAEALPFDAGSCSAVVGACVLDVLPDPAPALREMRRVLAPGGCIVHFLDLAPNFEREVSDLAAEGQLVLPNLFSDPSASRWPEDLLVTEWACMKRLLVELDARAQPLPRVFGHYFQNFERTPFDAKKAAREYEAFSRGPEMRELLKTMLAAGYTMGFHLGVPAPAGTLVSSGRRLAQRLERAARDMGLTVELNDMRTAWAHAKAANEEDPRYRSLSLGHERRQAHLPETLLCSDALPASPSEILLEAGMLVFAARA